MNKLKVETHLLKPGVRNPYSFLSSHIFIMYINLHTHSNMYAIHQSRMLFRNVYRFGRKSPFLGCLMSCSLSPSHRDCTEAFCWCSQRPGGTCAGTCNFPVKLPRSILVTQGGASPRGTVHRGHTLSRGGVLHLLHSLWLFRGPFI